LCHFYHVNGGRKNNIGFKNRPKKIGSTYRIGISLKKPVSVDHFSEAEHVEASLE